MANLFLSLPLPVGNGSGAAADASDFGSIKTFTVTGSGGATVTIEMSNDAGATKWAPVCSFRNPGEKTVQVACSWLRVTVSNSSGPGLVVAVGGTDQGTTLAELVAPAGNGTGPATDVSTLGTFKTVQVGGSFTGAINIEVSEDGGATYSEILSFNQPGIQTTSFAADFMRVKRNGASGSGAPLVNVAGIVVDGSGVTPPFDLETFTIYARHGGSDVSGKGTLARPYRTFRRAIRDVPLTIDPGNRYIVDVTGIGVEVFPFSYCMPAIQTPTVAYNNDSTIPFYFFAPALSVRAIPQLASTIPPHAAVIKAADGAVITADPDTNLITLTIPPAGRASWTTPNLRGKIVVRTVGSYQAACVISDATATTLTLTNNAANFNGGVGPVVFAPGEELHIVEQSAEFQGNVAGALIDITGVDAWQSFSAQISSIGFQGIKFTQPGNPFPGALGLSAGAVAALELCDVQGLTGLGPNGTYSLSINASVLRDNLFALQSAMFIQACLVTDIAIFYLVAVMNSFFNTIIDASTSVSGGFQSFVPPAVTPIAFNATFNNVLIRNPTGLTTYGIYLTQGRVDLAFVQINGASDGLRLEDGVTFASLTHVTGTGNTGVGVIANDGATVQVHDPATNITGAGGDLKSGSLPPRLWSDFFFNAPIGNEYDLQTPFVLNVASGLHTPQGNETATPCTGTRIFWRP